MTLVSILLFGVVVLITHFLEGITGFGCTVLALPFCVLLVGIKTAVPTLVILAWILALYVIIIDFKNILWKEFIRIVTFVGLGLPIGMILFSKLPENILKWILGVFMIVVSIRGLYTSFRSDAKTISLNKYVMNLILFLGGIIHGAFGSGGPFVVIYASKALPNKSNFRATICLLWLSLNSVIIGKNIYGGLITGSVLKLLLCTIPFLVVGMLLGNKAHNSIDEKVFIKVVYGVLLISGFFMFL
ncbi:sulfite exporter TauE/SafE family protein [Clostridium sediminicola]|uniref:sulfite exporter TauE/SafE family protein n=1 Tax=Clostridium sediminicola TaxID=3114879 RepID=UPI0031F1F21D